MTRDERQEIARKKWITNRGKGTLEFVTGFGKTRTALKCLKTVLNKYPQLSIIVVVPTTTLKAQWEAQLPAWDLVFNTQVHVINSVIKHDWQADILVIDECHKYAAELFQQVFEKVKYKYILGLTATFDRLDGKQEIIAKYCPVIDKVTTTEALINGWVAEFTEYLVLVDVDDIEDYNKANKEFNEHFGFFSYDWELAMSMIGPKGFYNRAKLRDKMCLNGSDEQRKAIFNSITYHATAFMRAIQQRKAFINNHPKKIELAHQIINARPNDKILTFSNNVKMAEAVGGSVYTGKDSKKKGRMTLDEFSNASNGVLNSVKKLVEGADIPNLSVAIVLGHDSSGTRAIQTRGRVIRKEGDKKAEIFNIVINNTVETKWFEKSHQDSPYLTISEHGLQQVLEGKTPDLIKFKIKDYTLRY